eukprot:2562767-Rhodomonas_salina.2
MPGMSGVEVTQQLREEHGSNRLPVIMVSARGSEEDIVQGLAAGCNGPSPHPTRPNMLDPRLDPRP